MKITNIENIGLQGRTEEERSIELEREGMVKNRIAEDKENARASVIKKVREGQYTIAAKIAKELNDPKALEEIFSTAVRILFSVSSPSKIKESLRRLFWAFDFDQSGFDKKLIEEILANLFLKGNLESVVVFVEVAGIDKDEIKRITKDFIDSILMHTKDYEFINKLIKFSGLDNKDVQEEIMNFLQDYLLADIHYGSDKRAKRAEQFVKSGLLTPELVASGKFSELINRALISTIEKGTTNIIAPFLALPNLNLKLAVDFISDYIGLGNVPRIRMYGFFYHILSKYDIDIDGKIARAFVKKWENLTEVFFWGDDRGDKKKLFFDVLKNLKISKEDIEHTAGNLIIADLNVGLMGNKTYIDFIAEIFEESKIIKSRVKGKFIELLNEKNNTSILYTANFIKKNYPDLTNDPEIKEEIIKSIDYHIERGVLYVSSTLVKTFNIPYSKYRDIILKRIKHFIKSGNIGYVQQILDCFDITIFGELAPDEVEALIVDRFFKSILVGEHGRTLDEITHLNLPEEKKKELGIKGLEYALTHKRYRAISEIIDYFGLDYSILYTDKYLDDLINTVGFGLAEMLFYNTPHLNVINFINNFKVADEIKKKIINFALKSSVDSYSISRIMMVADGVELFGFQKSDISPDTRRVVFFGVISMIKAGNVAIDIDTLERCFDFFGFDQETEYNWNEIEGRITQLIIDNLSDIDKDRLVNLISKFKINLEVLRNKGLALVKIMTTRGDAKSVLDIVGKLDLSGEKLKEYILEGARSLIILDPKPSPRIFLALGLNNDEIREMVFETIGSFLKKGNHTRVDQLVKQFESIGIRKEELQAVVCKIFPKIIENKGSEGIKRMIDEYEIPESIIQTPEVRAVIKENIQNIIAKKSDTNEYISEIKNLIELISADPEDFIDTVIDGLAQNMAKGVMITELYISRFELIFKNFSDKYILIVENAIAFALENHGFSSVIIDLMENNHISDEFILSDRIQKSARNYILESEDENWGKMAEKISKIFRLPDIVKKSIVETVRIFKEFADRDSYLLVKSILEGKLTQDIKELGITEGGMVGLRQLEKKAREIKDRIYKERIKSEEILKSLFTRAIFKRAIKFEESDWGSKEEDTIETIIKSFEVEREQGLTSLSPKYFESSIVRVGRINVDERNEFEFSEPCRVRFSKIASAIKEAMSLFTRNKPLSYLVEQIEGKKEELINYLLQRKELRSSNERAVESISRQIEELTSIDPRSIVHFGENFHILAKHEIFHDILMELVFFMAISKHKQEKEMADKVIGKHNENKIDFESIEWLLNFIDQIVNKETMAKYFENTPAVESFKKIINPRAFEQELSRAQDQDIIGRISLQFVPSRGLLFEFSGYIADACWASGAGSLARHNRNKFAVTMIQNPETIHQTTVGSCIVIEAEDKEGNPLLIVRGLNPIQNLVTQISLDSFYEAFSKYIKELAERNGRKAAIVIDDSTNGSATNRPTLFNFLFKKRNDLKKVILKSEEDTTFNGYDITQHCYLM